MPIWQKCYDDWKAMLAKPKNLALKGGGGTGISKAIEEVKAADTAFENDHSTYGDLVHKLDALAAACSATENKHKKIFTEACNEAAAIRITATNRKESAKKEYQKVLDDIKTLCNGVANELKHVPSDRPKADAHWAHFLDVLPKLGRNVSALRQGMDNLRTQPHPAISARPISDYADAITDFVGHFPHL